MRDAGVGCCQLVLIDLSQSVASLFFDVLFEERPERLFAVMLFLIQHVVNDVLHRTVAECEYAVAPLPPRPRAFIF